MNRYAVPKQQLLLDAERPWIRGVQLSWLSMLYKEYCRNAKQLPEIDYICGKMSCLVQNMFRTRNQMRSNLRKSVGS